MLLQKSKFDWQFNAESNNACQASTKGCYWPRGKMLGGSSAMNYMIYIRGFKDDFNHWYNLGNPGWDYESVLRYFKKAEGNQYEPFVTYQNGKYHSASGPLKVDFFDSVTTPLDQMILDGQMGIGNPLIDDINADKLLGTLRMQGTVSNARRQSSAKAYLIPAMDRKNLHIITDAYVEKILIDKNRVAYGVQFRYREKHVLKAFARREVILSAGAVKSPQVLMLSGIGPKNMLQKHNIPVKSDVAVGQNLYDHILTKVWLKMQPFETSDQLDSLYQFSIHGSGPLSTIGVTRIFTLINTVNGTGQADFFLANFYFPRNSPGLSGFVDNVAYRDEIREALLNENKNYDLLVAAIMQAQPKSKGYIELATSNPHDNPIIKPRYFTHPEDMEGVLRAIKKVYSLINTKAYRAKNVQIIRFPIAECDCYKFQSDDYSRCYIKQFAGTTFHPVGTSKMGPDSDREAVVDPGLRVRNIKRLRQIDAGM